MENLRKYGNPPYTAAVIHGGPGAAGDLASVAKELSKQSGILEPLQTEASIKGQIEELRKVLEDNAELPVILIGHSWGAWLSSLFAAHYPNLIGKLILVGSGPFEEKYAESIMPVRFSRLRGGEKLEALAIIEKLNSPDSPGKDLLLARFGELMAKTDAYDTEADDSQPETLINWEIHDKVWREADQMRKSGELLRLAKTIRCPVVAIHGNYDPHPLEGVEIPLSQSLQDFRIIPLEKCGHYPWKEKSARSAFFEILQSELK